MSGRHHFRRPDPMLLLVAAVTIGTVMSMTVKAAEPVIPVSAFQQAQHFAAFDDDGFRVGRIGDTDAGLHVSMLPPPEFAKAMPASSTSNQDLKNMLDVYLTVRLPW